jgi:hypothetical protein
LFSIEDYVLQPVFTQYADGAWPAYLPLEQNLANLEAVANVPLMIGEYSFTSTVNSSGDPSTVPFIYEAANSQQQCASNYENFIAPLYEDTPALVGDDWFQYVDEPASGRSGDGENDDFGMIDVDGTPYPEMVSATQMMHGVIADETGDSGSVCDSWTTNGSGVSCTANMPSSTASPLTIVTTSLPTGNVGASYANAGVNAAANAGVNAAANAGVNAAANAGVNAAGGTPGYSYTLTQGSLPSGLTLNPTNGLISGTPTSSGTSSFTVQASDSAGDAPVSQALTLTVDPEVPVSVTSTSLDNGTQNQPYQEVLGVRRVAPSRTPGKSLQARCQRV